MLIAGLLLGKRSDTTSLRLELRKLQLQTNTTETTEWLCIILVGLLPGKRLATTAPYYNLRCAPFQLLIRLLPANMIDRK